MTDSELQEFAESRFLVEHLSGSVVPSKQLTGVAQRIYDRRHSFFLNERRQLFECLEKIGREWEGQMGATIQKLQVSTETSQTRLGTVLTECDPRSSPANLTLQSFRQASNEIECDLAERRNCILITQKNIEKYEESRKEQIAEVFDQFSPIMIKNSHLLALDVNRWIEQELLTVNQIILRNRRVYLNLFERLMVEAVIKAKQSQETLKLNQSEWKEQILKEAVENAEKRLQTCCVVRSEDMNTVIENILENQKPILWTRMAIMSERETLVPPLVTVEKCRDWLKRAEDATRDLYDAVLEGVQLVRQLGESLHLSFYDDVSLTAQTLLTHLACTEEEVDWKFKEPCMHKAAKRQAELENDLQSYTLQVNEQKVREVALINSMFIFVHGAVWHWELHLTSVAKAEEFLDRQLQNTRAEMHELIDSKAAKVKGILEGLRHSWTPAVTNGHVHAAANTVADVDHQLRETRKRTQTCFESYPTLINILSRGYQQRICAYLQYAVDDSLTPKPTSVLSHRLSLAQTQPVSHAAEPPEKLCRKLPDIVLEEEKNYLQNLGLTATDSENLGIRLKTIPFFDEHGHRPPPTSVISTRNGVILSPHPAELTDSFRFAKVKKMSASAYDCHDELSTSVGAETVSQVEMTKDMTFVPPRRSSLVNLSSLVDVLPEFAEEAAVVAEIQGRLTESFLSHVVDDWHSIVIRHCESLMKTKQEALELDVQTQLRCLSLWTVGFLDAVVKTRAAEVADHEEAFKVVDNAVTGTISDFKLVQIANINKLINDRLTVTKENLIILEKGLVNASRQNQIDSIKKRMKDEVGCYLAYIRKSVHDFRSTVHPRYLELHKQVLDAVAAMKKFADGGTYSSDEVKHYDVLLNKFLGKLTSAEKSTLEEIRVIEVKRKTVIESYLNKVSEKVPAHEADVAAVQMLTGLLAKTQIAIKKEAALINFAYADVCERRDTVERAIATLKVDLTSSKVDPEKITILFLDVLQELRSACNQLGCLLPLWTVSSPSNSISSNSSPISTTNSTILSFPTPNSMQQDSTTRVGDRSSNQSVRQSTVFQPSTPRWSKVDLVREIPTDFQLATSDGPIALVVPRMLVPFDIKSIELNCAGASPFSGANASDANGSRFERDSLAASAALKRKQKRMERYLVFGEAPLLNTETFLLKILVICRQALKDGLNYAEEYHRVRGSRAITRPGLIPETFETLAEKLCKKLLNYLTQSEQFALVLTEKQRDLSNSLMEIMTSLTPLLFRRYLELFREELLLKRKLTLDDFLLENARVCDLRQNVDDIIVGKTLIRHNDVDGMLQQISTRTMTEWCAALKLLTMQFLQRMNGTAERLFAICDLILSPDELRAPLTPLIARAQFRISSTLQTPLDDTTSNGPAQIWRALMVDDIEGISLVDVGAKDFQCTRTTVAHLTVEDSRHRVYADFLELYREMTNYTQTFAVTKNISDDVGQTAFMHLHLKRLQVLDKMTVF